jgi:hypothetical protein
MLTQKTSSSFLVHDYSAKEQRGLGVVRLETHNKALLLKFLHKLFNNHDLP